MNLPTFDLYFTCPCCGISWDVQGARVIRDDECTCCGTVSAPKDYVERKG